MNKDFDSLTYGKTLKNIRKKNKLTQGEVAKITGIEAKYISKIENGNSTGTINTMLKFCKAYEVTPNDILQEFIKSEDSNFESNSINAKIDKLNKRDKKIVLSLIENLLEE